MKNRRSRSFWKRNQTTIIFLAVASCSVVGLYGLKQWKQAQAEKAQLQIREAEWPPVKAEIESMIANFDQSASENGMTKQTLDSLDSALKKWSAFRNENRKIYLPGAQELYDEIQNRRQLHLSEWLWKQSQKAEETARSLHDEVDGTDENIAEALGHMKQALSFQNQINDDFPQSTHTNVPRSAELTSWIHTIEAEPLHLKLLSIKQTAKQAMDAAEWELAKSRFQEAVKLQTEINDRFRDAPQSNITEVAKLEDQVAECEAQLLHNQVQSIRETAQTYMEADKVDMGIERLSEALEIQNNINLNYPNSSVFSMDQSNQIATTIQTIHAEREMQEILKMSEELKLIISVGMVDQISYKLSDLQNTLVAMQRDYPLFTGVPQELINMTDYLTENVDQLPTILETFNTFTKNAIASGNNSLVLTRLVPQKLYRLVEQTNPSRSKGTTRPVDSVSFEEAMSFCKHLNYLLPGTVSLPETEDFDPISESQKQIAGSVEWEWVLPENTPNNENTYIKPISGSIEKLQEKDSFYRSRTVGFRIKYIKSKE